MELDCVRVPCLGFVSMTTKMRRPYDGCLGWCIELAIPTVVFFFYRSIAPDTQDAAKTMLYGAALALASYLIMMVGAIFIGIIAGRISAYRWQKREKRG